MFHFDDTVPVETIEVPLSPEAQAIPEERRVVVGEKVTHRLAQRPGIRDSEGEEPARLYTAPAPMHVPEPSMSDVSFLAGMLVDQFLYHLPLYRQHQRLRQGGIADGRLRGLYAPTRSSAAR